nr:MAG TPA: hypothetical protein [Caudoviricetes sp.]
MGIGFYEISTNSIISFTIFSAFHSFLSTSK